MKLKGNIVQKRLQKYYILSGPLAKISGSALGSGYYAINFDKIFKILNWTSSRAVRKAKFLF